jgi:hypothetical protein
MPVFRDRVKDTTTSTGSGSIALYHTPPLGYRSFNAAFGTNTVFLYCIEDPSSGDWETGSGYLSDSATLVRDNRPFDGSAGAGNLVNFGAGTKNVFCTVTSHFLEDVDTGALAHKAIGYAMP